MCRTPFPFRKSSVRPPSSNLWRSQEADRSWKGRAHSRRRSIHVLSIQVLPTAYTTYGTLLLYRSSYPGCCFTARKVLAGWLLGGQAFGESCFAGCFTLGSSKPESWVFTARSVG
ncbi:hypothetical protein FA15DRAFT_58841 [Coprinopsis marcescibilis]|uniref:Uncharacterized protein n=1 Tax=Coprinopsis marcescibilis TaxID=230819 RepID=A0A5C3L6U8_COPMA|nr:hypothetical protein FA15DRAFT_58841 [Coprinopsis marcescibilis]